jgi:hypothetical protein
MAGLEKEFPTQHKEKSDSSDHDSELDSPFTPKEQAKIRHRIDRRLIPALGMMYGISLMDRKVGHVIPFEQKNISFSS